MVLSTSDENHRLFAEGHLKSVEENLDAFVGALRSRKCQAAHVLLLQANKHLGEAHADLTSIDGELGGLSSRYVELHEAIQGAVYNFKQICLKKTLEGTCSTVRGR